jgi:hypothetical protein
MSENDEKKARLEAIRAANRAKAATEGGAAAEVPAAAPAAAPVATAAPAAAANMSDEKAARLAAIRAANAAKAGDTPAATATTTNLSAPPAAPAAPRAAAPAAAAAAKPAAKPALPPRKQIPRLYKVIGGIVFMTIVCVLLATTTKQYILAVIFGVLLGGTLGLMFGSWPPGPGDEITGGE